MTRQWISGGIWGGAVAILLLAAAGPSPGAWSITKPAEDAKIKTSASGFLAEGKADEASVAITVFLHNFGNDTGEGGGTTAGGTPPVDWDATVVKTVEDWGGVSGNAEVRVYKNGNPAIQFTQNVTIAE